jgi:predicted transglutaminase-like cysteine proteinase
LAAICSVLLHFLSHSVSLCDKWVGATGDRIMTGRLIGAIIGASLLATSISAGAAGQIQQASLHHFPKWTDMMDRVSQAGLPDQLYRLADHVRHLPRDRQMAAIAEWVQLFPYLGDRDRFGRSDYWATPAEFVLRGGDCEDAAIAAYYALGLLGVPAGDRAIAVVEDTRRGVLHAVTQVVVNGEVWVIDQLEAEPRRWSEIDHFTVHYIINDRWWSTEPLEAPVQIAQAG